VALPDVESSPVAVEKGVGGGEAEPRPLPLPLGVSLASELPVRAAEVEGAPEADARADWEDVEDCVEAADAEGLPVAEEDRDATKEATGVAVDWSEARGVPLPPCGDGVPAALGGALPVRAGDTETPEDAHAELVCDAVANSVRAAVGVVAPERERNREAVDS
jgi:hypothetical protein